jgi:hypothetical protein
MCRISAAGQYDYMKDAVQYLEQNKYVEKYAWFSYNFGGSEAALATNSGLTDLGLLYYKL